MAKKYGENQMRRNSDARILTMWNSDKKLFRNDGCGIKLDTVDPAFNETGRISGIY